MSEVFVVADYRDLCGEGPVWDPDSNCLYWTDIDGKKFYRYDSANSRHELVKDGLEIAGYALNRPAGFAIANSSGIWLWDGADDLQLIVSEVKGTKCQMNDAIADPEGRFFAGSNFYDPEQKYEPGKLIRVERDGSAQIVDEGFQLPNGLAFSPDERTMYFTDSAARRIYAYDYDKRSGDLHNRKVLVQGGDGDGLPDGLCVDADGFLWSAQWYGGCVIRYDPDGKEERRIAIPAKQVSSIAFGGKDLTDMFITSAGKPWPSPLMPRSYDPSSGNIGGQLFRVNLGLQGKSDYQANVSVPPDNLRK